MIPWRYKFERASLSLPFPLLIRRLSLSVAVKWLLLRLPPPSNAQSASMTSPTAVAVLS